MRSRRQNKSNNGDQMNIIKIKYSIEPRDVRGYGFLAFAKNMGRSLSNKYDQKHLDSAKKSTTHATKNASKKAI